MKNGISLTARPRAGRTRGARPTSRRLAFAAILCASCVSSHAELIGIAWNIDQRFDQLVEVAPGKSTELCSPLAKGVQVRWSFDSPVALDFDIHFHVGEKVVYPARHDATARAEGTLAVTLGQDYCWTWTNRSIELAKVRVKLAR